MELEHEDFQYHCGATLSPFSEDDVFIEKLAGYSVEKQLPSEFFCNIPTPIRDQGQRETCVSQVEIGRAHV